jgi:hypothetical protein
MRTWRLNPAPGCSEVSPLSAQLILYYWWLVPSSSLIFIVAYSSSIRLHRAAALCTVQQRDLLDPKKFFDVHLWC